MLMLNLLFLFIDGLIHLFIYLLIYLLEFNYTDDQNKK